MKSCSPAATAPRIPQRLVDRAGMRAATAKATTAPPLGTSSAVSPDSANLAWITKGPLVVGGLAAEMVVEEDQEEMELELAVAMGTDGVLPPEALPQRLRGVGRFA